MATLNITMEELYAQFKARADLEAKVAELQAKLDAVEIAPKKARKPKTVDPDAPKKQSKKPGLPPEELAERRRQNGLRLAAANKARKEAEHQAWLAEQLELKKAESSASGSSGSEAEEADD
jgi:hypothetical protein